MTQKDMIEALSRIIEDSVTLAQTRKQEDRLLMVSRLQREARFVREELQWRLDNGE